MDDVTAANIRCPTCGASQQSSTECRRCKCDLSLVVSAHARRERLREACITHLAAGDVPAAISAARRCWEVSPDREAARLLAVGYLLDGRYQAAVELREQVERISPPPEA